MIKPFSMSDLHQSHQTFEVSYPEEKLNTQAQLIDVSSSKKVLDRHSSKSSFDKYGKINFDTYTTGIKRHLRNQFSVINNTEHRALGNFYATKTLKNAHNSCLSLPSNNKSNFNSSSNVRCSIDDFDMNSKSQPKIMTQNNMFLKNAQVSNLL